MHTNTSPTLDAFGLTFRGGLRVRELQATRCSVLPASQGVYLIVRNSKIAPQFLETSVGGWFKGRNPSVAVDVLTSKLVDASPIVYIGKAGGTASPATFQSRLWQYMEFGMGKDIGHWVGRHFWQLADHADLSVWWKTTDRGAERVESELLDRLIAEHGKIPFVNLKGGKR